LRFFLFAKELFSIRERTFGHPEKKKLAAAELFYSRKRFFLFAKELFSIGERTFGHPEKKKLAAAELFSIRERDFFYSRKRFFLFAKELFSIRERILQLLKLLPAFVLTFLFIYSLSMSEHYQKSIF